MMQALTSISRAPLLQSRTILTKRLAQLQQSSVSRTISDSPQRSDGSLPRRDPYSSSDPSNLPRREPENPYRSLCKLTLIGRTGTPPEIREFDDGSSSLTLNVATNHSAGTSEDRKIETQWHKVFVAGNVTGFSVLSDLAVGSLVYIEGNMRVNNVEREGETRQYVNVRVHRGEGMVRILSSPKRHDDLPF